MIIFVYLDSAHGRAASAQCIVRDGLWKCDGRAVQRKVSCLILSSRRCCGTLVFSPLQLCYGLHWWRGCLDQQTLLAGSAHTKEASFEKTQELMTVVGKDYCSWVSRFTLCLQEMTFHGVEMAGPIKDIAKTGCSGRWKGNVQRDILRAASRIVTR